MNKPSIITAIAVESINELETAANYMDWLDSLTWAIKRTLVDGNDHHAERLADVAQYLAGDYRETLISNAKRLNERFDAHQDNAFTLKVGGVQ
ncbi:hypothetical protein GHO42_21655 [Pseudomonas sp. FSL R10-0056]|uniref:hypothetical protein n=1 Tax=unclassified Pseudomonas TaxID=196821 RepID=UPI001297C65A|nr:MULTISPECIES: hypothetical protein [unclassified Pseudomonas]MQT65672.1 hypothetical protein [Pseudomonas sp. FSL R10-0056]MQT70894.1 hypothetical protein [Pseudomonas sp. FSL R10-0071]MQU50068.1 hypothetical protein [Pseudomonas sp. FSL A6-1183]